MHAFNTNFDLAFVKFGVYKQIFLVKLLTYFYQYELNKNWEINFAKFRGKDEISLSL